MDTVQLYLYLSQERAKQKKISCGLGLPRNSKAIDGSSGLKGSFLCMDMKTLRG